MHDFFSPENDPLEETLGALTQPRSPEYDALRQKVYGQTIRVLRRRRWVRQFALAAALLVSFAAGLLSMWLILPTHPAGNEIAPAPSARNDAPQPIEKRPVTALDEEWFAFDSDAERGERYRRAGDRYLKDENDPLSALRCYTNALDAGSEADLSISTNDNWLLMAIKDAREKEQSHAKNGG